MKITFESDQKLVTEIHPNKSYICIDKNSNEKVIISIILNTKEYYTISFIYENLNTNKLQYNSAEAAINYINCWYYTIAELKSLIAKY